jgi:1,4-dihydroxy-2-naphthoyl-CoA synthase
MTRNNPTALRLIKAALNAHEDGAAGIQVGRRFYPG